MYRIVFILLITLLSLPINLMALKAESDKAIVTGVVYDSHGNPIPGATVSLIKGDELEAGVATNEIGEYELEVEPGTYTLRISFVSYSSYEETIELSSSEVLETEPIELLEETRELGEVVVETQTADVEIRFDRRIYRADADIEAMGGSALDLIDNIPSVESDIEGNLSLRGSENVRVLINGRSSSLLSDGTEALSALPSESIDRIEVMPNPSARYQAEGDAGVINIILKRNRVAGFNGSILGRSGIPGDHRLSSNLNFMSNRVNWFTNIGFRYRDRPSEAYRFQRFESPDTSYIYNQNQERNRNELRGSIRTGAEIFIGDRHTLTPSVYFRVRDRNNQTDTFYSDLTLEETPLREVFREEDLDDFSMDMEVDLAYEMRFDNENRLLKVDARFDYSPESETGSLFEENRTLNQILGVQRTDISEERTRVRMNIDYIHPLGDWGEFEAGGRSSLRWVDNRYDVEELVGGVWNPLERFSSDFNYFRSVNSLYAILSSKIGDLSIQTGLRAEQTLIDTEVLSTGTTSRQNYLNLFPSVFLGYELSERHSIQTSYSRRFSRPRIRSILPFSNFRDSRNIFVGNPELEPVYSNSYEISYLRFWENGSLTTSLYHRYRTGVTERISNIQEDGVTVRTPVNLSNQSNWGGELSLDQNIGNSLRFRGSINYYFSETEGFLNNQEFIRSANAAYGRMRFQWRVMEGLNFQTTFRYSSPRNTTQGSRGGSYNVNSAVSKDLWDGKATLSLNAFDLFNTRGRTTIIDEPGFYSENENRWRSRSIRVNFVYRFSQFDS